MVTGGSLRMQPQDLRDSIDYGLGGLPRQSKALMGSINPSYGGDGGADYNSAFLVSMV